MKKSAALLILLLAAAAIGVYLATQYLTPSQTPAAGGKAEAYIGVLFTVTFTDGTVQTFDPNPQMSIAPLDILIGGKQVASINVKVKIRFYPEKTVSDWRVSISQRIEVYKKPEVVPKTSSTGSFVNSGTTWAYGEVKVVSQTPIEGSLLENAVAQYGTGDWFFNVYVTATLTATYTDGTTVQLQGSNYAGIDFTYATSGVQGLSIVTFEVPMR
jgi:hypothetical protein